MSNHPYQFSFVDSVHKINKHNWNKMAKDAGPFLQYEFFAALEDSQSTNEKTGWLPNHLVISDTNKIVGILPLFIKDHSYGEYVFDFAWANAYQQHQLDYYPKLVNAVPFTPVSGVRLLLDDQLSQSQLIPPLVSFIKQHLRVSKLSSFHSLFNQKAISDIYQSQGVMQRHNVQFQWFNNDYSDFSDFLSTFTSRRRKSVRNERKKVQSNQITIERLHGKSICAEDMQFFYHCYCQTYLKRSGHTGYLTKLFFQMLLETMAENLLLVIATKDSIRCAGALYLFDQQQLCGRYWGALQEVDGLHFECCYYQGIEFCIEQNLLSFNPGTQGEHKILRGFEPIYCYSNHWLARPDFQVAVEHFINQESSELARYKHQAAELLPFKKES